GRDERKASSVRPLQRHGRLSGDRSHQDHFWVSPFSDGMAGAAHRSDLGLDASDEGRMKTATAVILGLLAAATGYGVYHYKIAGSSHAEEDVAAGSARGQQDGTADALAGLIKKARPASYSTDSV